MENKIKKILSEEDSSVLFEARKYYFAFDSRLKFYLFSNRSYSQRYFDVAQRCENLR